MITEFIKQWEENKHLLKDSFEQKEPESYEDIYKRLFELVITKPIRGYSEWDWSRYKCIDDGDYQGNYVFLLCDDSYQPSIYNYIFTNVSYGSCSGCDTFESIYCDYEEEDEKIKQYMILALHMVQETKTFDK